MTNIEHLEYQYLKAKIAYYEGTPIMSDSAFDYIEKQLKEAGSKVIDQVGSKRKDFDFKHPTKMLSLAKLQTYKIAEATVYKEEDFNAWYNKKCAIIGHTPILSSSPKFDGNAINIIYKGTKLLQVLTRGDGFTGKDVSERFKSVIPEELTLNGLTIDEDQTVEIRCEVVIDTKIFAEKYADEFSNPRNFVAGVLGKDDYNEEKIKDLTIIPLHFIVDGIHREQRWFTNTLYSKIYEMYFWRKDYVTMMKNYEKLRETFQFQLDGVVISFPCGHRYELGENEHEPNWSVAIKFVPDEVITSFEGLDWNVGKTGELAPVILLKPVQLAGTIVKRASGYNAGYIVNNNIGPGAVFRISKAGEIIPEVQEIVVKSFKAVMLPTHCPSCQSELTFDGIHLMCQNENCLGKIAKKLASASGVIDLKNVGGRTLEPFAKDFKNMFELMKAILRHSQTNAQAICSEDGKIHSTEEYGIKYGSRSHEIFVNAFRNIKSLTYEQIIIMLGYDNVGRKLSMQIAREHCGLEPNYASLERALVAKLHEPEIESYIKRAVSALESLGVLVDKPETKLNKNKNMETIKVCMTGSPREFGFKTKEEFISQFENVEEVSISSKECQFLITDSYESSSNKMKVAEKKGITIKTYGDFKV